MIDVFAYLRDMMKVSAGLDYLFLVVESPILVEWVGDGELNEGGFLRLLNG